MTRIFQRGELRRAVLAALGDVEPASGYAIMQALVDSIGGSWRASPGAVYPALLSLEDAGLVEGTDDDSGSKVYRRTPAGRQLAVEVAGTLATVADRARRTDPTHTVGSLLDAFNARIGGRTRRLDPETAHHITLVLDGAATQLERILNREKHTHG